MKTLNTLIAIGFTALLVSCGSSKDTTTKDVSQNRGSSNVETTSSSRSISNAKSSRTNSMNPNGRNATTEASKTVAATRNVVNEDTMDYNQMYKKLDMTPKQIAAFEAQWKRTSEDWTNNNGDKTMNNYERTEYQDKILRDILDEKQFSNYQQWVRDNAGKQ